MSRRLLDLCLLAYPRARREADRAFLRDLALELAERHGLAQQAVSLLLGGFRARIEAGRKRRAVRAGTWRAVVAAFVLAALALAADGLVGVTAGDLERIEEVEQFECDATAGECSRGSIAIVRDGP